MLVTRHLLGKYNVFHTNPLIGKNQFLNPNSLTWKFFDIKNFVIQTAVWSLNYWFGNFVIDSNIYISKYLNFIKNLKCIFNAHQVIFKIQEQVFRYLKIWKYEKQSFYAWEMNSIETLGKKNEWNKNLNE